MKSAGGFHAACVYLDSDLYTTPVFRAAYRDNSVPTYVNNSFAQTGQYP